MSIKMKRVYDPIESTDGTRILIDRLWPRGIKKGDAEIHLWIKDVAPSHDLRKWYHQNMDRYDEFNKKYMAELSSDEDKMLKIEQLFYLAIEGTITFLYSSRNREQNHAIILKEILEERFKE